MIQKIIHKLFSLIRSMRFGLLLMGLITALSVVGTVIPQGRELVWYVQTYPGAHPLILTLKLHDVYNSWYFQLLLVLLALNLTLCSLIRVRSVARARARGTELLLKQPPSFPLEGGQRDALRLRLTAMRCRESAVGDALVYRKNSFGRYGSFITHLSILLTILFGAMALYLPKVSFSPCLPGESVRMEDGTEIAVDSFRIEDAEGRLDYTSELRVRLPDGRESGTREIKVNHPLSFGAWKIYQQSFDTAGVVSVRNLETDESDTFTLTHRALLSLDGVTGLWYEGVYPDLIRDADGTVRLVTNSAGSYPNPVYQAAAVSDGGYSPVLAFPGDELPIGSLLFTFEKPLEYPGLRIKYTPRAINLLLCASFLLMTAGLYMTFFCQSVLVRLDRDGCAVGGPKPEGMLLTVQEWLNEIRSGEER